MEQSDSRTQRNTLKESFFKSQASSFAATVVDHGMLAICTELLGIYYIHSKIIGASCGAVVSFLLGKTWAFKGSTRSSTSQLIKYIGTSITSAYLNVQGVYILTEHYNIQYFISSLIVALVVSVFFNFFMYRYFVFK